MTEAVSPVRMVSAKNVIGPLQGDAIGLTGPQLSGLSDAQIAGIKGEKSNLTENMIPSPLAPENLTTEDDANMRAGSYSPETVIGVLPPKPQDITILCEQCGTYINLKSLPDHRFLHRSLKLLKYKGLERPESVAKLVKRRQAILKRIKKQAKDGKSVDPNEIQKVNDAFEFLKADIEDTFDSFRYIQFDHETTVRGIGLNCSAACASAVGICSDSNDRYKSYMEDTRVFQDYFGNDRHKCFFGVYDGHHGRFASEITANELHHALLKEMSKFDPRTKCTCTYNMADNYDISQYEIHSRAQSRMSERGQMHEESANVIHQIIRTCEEKFAELDNIMNEKSETKKDDKEKQNSKEKKKKERDPFAEKMSQAFVKSHKYVDYLLSWGKDEQSRVRWSGCSTLSCVVQDKDVQLVKDVPEEDDENIDSASMKSDIEPPKDLGVIHLANAGNSHAVLVRGNRAYQLTRDHTPNNPKEKNRVLKEGVTISESERDLRLNGVLATTRGLGNHGDVSLKKAVSTTPYTTSVAIDQYAQFLILASHGVWEVFSDQEAASLLLQMFPYNQMPPSSSIASSVAKILIDSQSRVGTNSEAGSEVASEAARMVFGGALRSSQSFNPGDTNSPLTNIRQSARASAKSRTSVKFADEEDEAAPGVEQAAPGVEPEAPGVDGQGDRVHRAISAKKPEPKKSLSKKKPHDSHDPTCDLQTEVGSNIDIYSDEDFDDSGNEADIDTISDGLTLPTSSRMNNRVPTRDEIQREFARKLSERLVQSAMLAGAKDNITAMVILLPGSGLSC